MSRSPLRRAPWTLALALAAPLALAAGDGPWAGGAWAPAVRPPAGPACRVRLARRGRDGPGGACTGSRAHGVA